MGRGARRAADDSPRQLGKQLMPVLFRDVETRSAVDLKATGAHRYAADPTTEVLCIGYAVDDGPADIWIPGQPIPAPFVEAARNPDWLVIAHNDAFERAIEEHILTPRHGWPQIPIDRHRCTMAMALAAALPGALDKAVAALDLPYSKDKAGQVLMRRMSKPRPDGTYIDDPESHTRLRKYCQRDIEAERATYRALPPLTAEEQQIWQLDAVINARGFHTDGALLDAASQVVAAAEESAQAEFRQITSLDSTNQVARFVAWLAAHGCIVTDVQKGTLKHALRRAGLASEVRRAIELRLELAHASAAKVEALRTWRGADGRVRGTLIYCGAATGRWVGRGPQPQNFKRDGEDIDTKVAAVMNGGAGLASPVEAVGEIARAMIVAAPGCRLLIADFSGIESRVLAWIAGQRSKIDAWARFDQTGDPNDDPYQIIGRSLGHREDKARAFGKIADLAFGYQGGVRAWQNFAPEGDVSDDAVIQQYRDRWRDRHPAVVQFWYAVDRAAISALCRPGADLPAGQITFRYDAPFLRVRLPSGRAISYPFPRIGTNRMSRPCVIFKDNAGGKFTDCKFGQGAYGGLWTENVVSGIARDLLAAALCRLEAAGYPVVLHVHDEVVCEAPDGFGTVEEFKQLVTAVPEWAEGLPVAAKVRNGRMFCKAETTTEFHGPTPCSPPNAASLHDEDDDNANFDGAEEAPFSAEESPDHDDEQPAAEEPKAEQRTQDGYPHGERDTGHQAAFFIYRHADNQPYLGVKKTSTKQFPQFHWIGTRWEKGAPQGPKIPYRLPELIRAPLDAWVVIAAGEKDADTAAALGFVATTNPEGERKGAWAPELNAWFQGRPVALMEDNDETGRAHVIEVAEALRGKASDIRIITFRDLPEHGDLTDWVQADPARHGNKELLAMIEAAPKFEHPPLPFINMSHWDSEPIPDQEWTVPFKIPIQECALFSGEGGAGKSMEGLHLCTAHVLGGECWHTTVRQGPAIFVDAEDTEAVIHRRLAAVREHYGATFADLIKGGLHLMSLVGHDAVLATVNRSGKIEATALYGQLLQAAGDIKPVQMVIASSANVFAGNENDRSQTQQFISLLARLALLANGSTILISHPSLTGISSGSGLSGSTAWHNAVRARFVMRGIKPEEGEQPDNDLREIEFKKSQHSALSESIVVKYQNGMFLPVTGAALDQAMQEAKADQMFLDLLGRFAKDNRFVSDKTGANYAPALFAREEEAKREMITSKMLAAAMRRLFKAGAIWNEPCGKPSRPSYRIALKTGG
jgi:DNA polymerase